MIEAQTSALSFVMPDLIGHPGGSTMDTRVRGYDILRGVARPLGRERVSD